MSDVIHVHKAQTIGDQELQSGIIDIATTLPDSNQTPKIMQEDAEKIAEMLWETLPGGTLDRLVAELCRRHASMLIVRHQR